jgi:serine/threonine protein kinase
MARGRIGPFLLEESLGSGGRGRVYRAIHEEQRKVVALKRIPIPLLNGNPEAQRRLLEDFELLKKLDHPALAKSFGGFLQPQEACYAYEQVRGESVAETLDRRGRLSWEQSWDLLEPMIELLAYLHARDAYVGAFFPDRVLFDPLGSPRLVSLTGLWDRDRRPKGHPERGYIAPEIRNEDAPQVKSDLWSLGALAYACVTGGPPPETEGLAFEPPSMMTVATDCPYWFDRIVLQLLSPDPAARPFNAGAVQLALKEGRKALGQRVGVAEHAARGFSPIQIAPDLKSEALERLDRKPDEENPHAPEFDVGQAFPILAIGGMTVVLIALVGVIVWMLIPKPDARRLDDTAAMVASGQGGEMRSAQDILRPMLRRHPADELTPEIREQLDATEMYLSEEALRIRMEYGRPFKSEAERLYAKGREAEQLGDRVGAIEQYRSLVKALDPESDDRVWYKLAERDALRLEREGATTEQSEFVQSRLDEAEEHVEAGRIAEARKLWQSIVSLYRDDEHLLPLVQVAEQNLRVTEDVPQE